MFRDFADEFMCRQARQWKPATRRSNAAALRRDLLPVFGAMRLADSARANVQRWFDSMNVAPRTANRALPVLSVMMTPAELWDVRPQGSNPCRNMRRHRMKPRERFLALNEQKRLRFVLDHAEGRQTVAAIRLQALTGCRRSEALNLRWRNVGADALNLEDSKTGPRAVCTDAKLGSLRLHELRHSAASQAVMSGDGPPLSGRLLRRNRHCTTAGYAHLADAHLVEAVEKVGAIIATAMASQRPRPITLRQWLPQRSGARSTSKKLHQSGATVSPV